jgi:peptide deformylase
LLTWVNPEIVGSAPEHNWAWEGCLSVPGLRGWIRRPAAVAVRGYNAAGQRFSREYTGWAARVFQHEYDHLDGMLFPYRALDPHHLVATQEMAHRDSWPDGWPAPGARLAPYGEVVPE